MKKLFFLSTIALAFFASCGNSKPEDKTEATASFQYFGDTIKPEGAVAIEQLAAQMNGKDSLSIKITGPIEAVCQKKGCWMDMKLSEGKSMKVRFKDYAFFVPKDAAGKTTVFEGVAFTDTTSVADLQHYAEDAGKSKEDIAKITQPEVNIGFEAHGVIIQQ